MRILAIDPGLRACGIATMIDGQITTRTVRPQAEALPDRIREICGQIPPGGWGLFVIERPQVYRGRRQKGDPNDLISLAMLVGALIVRVSYRKLLLPMPAQWKGSVPKEIHHRRIRARIPDLSRCSKDALDAVGLALYGVDHARPET